MWKRLILCLFTLILPLSALSEGAQRVFLEGETEPFPEDAELLTVRVCPLVGADCMLLTLGEHSMLVDAGKSEDIDLVSAMLSGAGLHEVEYALNTHPHGDHLGGVKPLLDRGFGVGTFITFFPYDYTVSGQVIYQASAIQALEAAGVPVVTLNTEDTIPFGGARITAYRISDDQFDPSQECNDRSGVLMIQYGECSILLTGDIGNKAQRILAERYDLKADIMKYPHHGVMATYYAFLSDVRPEYVFFTHGSVGTKDAQNDLVRHGYKRMTFATWGTITLQTDGQKWIVSQDVKPELAEHARKYVPGEN